MDVWKTGRYRETVTLVEEREMYQLNSMRNRPVQSSGDIKACVEQLGISVCWAVNIDTITGNIYSFA